MPPLDHLAILRAGATAWKIWRSAHFLARPLLYGADLTHVALTGLDLCDADLRHARIRRANGADFRDADLTEAHLAGADLRRADLRHAHLCRADLRRADLRGAELAQTHLEGADLRGARGLRLDTTYTEGATLSPECDPWSLLRRRYSRLPNLVLPVLFLLLYSVPYLATTVPDLPGLTLRIFLALETSREFWFLGAALVLYTFVRVFLTWRVEALRQQETQSHHTPAWRHYRGLLHLHRAAHLLLAVGALAALTLTASGWLVPTLQLSTSFSLRP